MVRHKVKSGLFGFFIVLSLSCSVDKKSVDVVDDKVDLSIPRHFCGLDHVLLEGDRSTMVFSSEGRWPPQNFVFVVKQNRSRIDVVYHAVDTLTEFYSRDIPGPSLFFSGVTIVIDSLEWNDIQEKAFLILNTHDTEEYNDGIVDGQQYTISFDRRMVVVNSGIKRQRCEDFARYLQIKFVQPTEKMRRVPEDN